MRLVLARLIKLATDDGYVEVFGDRAYIGKYYLVDPTSRRVLQLTHTTSGAHHAKEVVDSYSLERCWTGWIPTELLDLTNAPEVWL